MDEVPRAMCGTGTCHPHKMMKWQSNDTRLWSQPHHHKEHSANFVFHSLKRTPTRASQTEAEEQETLGSIISMGEQSSAHVLLISFPGQGHVNPLLRLAKRIASKGLLVTFSSTDDIGRKISASTNSAAGATIPVGNGHLRFEFFSDGSHADNPGRSDINSVMDNIRTMWPSAVANLIRRQADKGHPVSCVINNPFIPWVLDVVADMNIPCALLWVQSCAVFTTYYYYQNGLAEFPTATRPDVSVTLPGLPTMKSDELPTFLLPSNPYGSLTEAILQQFHNLHKASWVLANSFEELERDAIRAISEFSPIIPVGPLVEADESQSGIRGDLLKAADCMEWLDTQEPLSVVYVSVGSVVVLTQEEVVEMAHGLRDAGRPFLWVLRENFQELLPQRFTDETKGRGMVVGWSPQDRVLAHGSVACFLTHCGWNSTLEVLTAGVPVVAYPQFGDQVPNAKFLVDVYGVGVRLRSPVGRKELASCVEEVTTGAAAEEMRRRAVRWKEAAGTAVAEGGSSDRNIQAFVDDIWRRAGGFGSDIEVVQTAK